MTDTPTPRLADAAFEATHLLSRFYNAVDSRDYAAVARCFTEEGEWLRLGRSLRGFDQVVEALNQRSEKLVTHHIVGNCVFDIPETGRCKVRYVITVFQSEEVPAPGKSLVAPSPRVGFCDAEVVATDAGWRLVFMAMRTPTFVAGWSER